MQLQSFWNYFYLPFSSIVTKISHNLKQKWTFNRQNENRNKNRLMTWCLLIIIITIVKNIMLFYTFIIITSFFMNFFHFLTSPLSIFNFNLHPQNASSNITFNHPINFNAIDNAHINPYINQSNQSNQINYNGIRNQNSYQLLKQMQNKFLQQQIIINQYLNLNIQLLSDKIIKIQQNSQQQSQSCSIQRRNQAKKKIKKQNINCGHKDRQHYAKGMCNNCYHRYGRTKRPWRCQHKVLYANGLCQNCYSYNHNKNKKQKSTQQINQP